MYRRFMKPSSIPSSKWKGALSRCTEWKVFCRQKMGRMRKLLAKVKKGSFQARAPSFGGGWTGQTRRLGQPGSWKGLKPQPGQAAGQVRRHGRQLPRLLSGPAVFSLTWCNLNGWSPNVIKNLQPRTLYNSSPQLAPGTGAPVRI